MNCRELEKTFATSLDPLQRAWRKGADKVIRRNCGHSLSLLSPIIALSRFGEGQRHGVLADLVGVEAPSLVRTVRELEAIGMIRRGEGVADARSKTIHLTDRGRAMAVRLEETLAQYRSDILGRIPADSLEVGIAVFEAMNTAIEKFNAAREVEPEVLA